MDKKDEGEGGGDKMGVIRVSLNISNNEIHISINWL